MEKTFNNIEKIDTFENESVYVQKCFTAMRMIAANPNIVRNIEYINSPVLERNYILSMVYNMGKSDYLGEDTKLNFGSGSYFVNGENNKYISTTNLDIKKSCKHFRIPIREKRGIEIIPDLDIHNSHSPKKGKTGDGQFLILEAKTTNRLTSYQFMRDFFKLNLYIVGLRFQNAVSLVINKPANIIDDYIGTYKKKGFYLCNEIRSKLRLFIQEKDTPEMFKLK